MTARVNTTQPWKEFSRSLLGINRDAKESRKYTESDVNNLLATELSSIQKAIKAKLNQEIEILGITCPDFIREHGYTRNLMDGVVQIQSGIKKGAVWPYLHSTRIAYQLNNAKTLGYPVGTDINLEDSHLLHFDYQNSLLKVSITAIGTDTTQVKRHFRIPDFGGTTQIASPKQLEYLCTRTKALIKVELSSTSGSYELPPQLSDFRRIIFSGDAPASEFKKIREAITKTIPEFSDRFIEDIEPGWVGAVGAARLAKIYKSYPHLFEIQEQIYENPAPHDEL
ncbi:hypothetical protein BP6252_04468 [Coleophoma cylindrospora]|uniref:Uncharacterized protein n=1 Tax=Coleophoma cylindrospora TaxID=1849047 RepID=A0A3D8S120_9HELO|nr:hypothetical protein BP6252_04468 [Coleophoma cylindrospora]